MTPHKCVKDDLLDELKEKVQTTGTRVLVLLGLISIFVFLVGFSVAQASSAKTQSERVEARVEAVNSRVSVQEERLKWILDGIQRIEKKLEEKP